MAIAIANVYTSCIGLGIY